MNTWICLLFFRHTIHLCPGDDLTFKLYVFPANTGYTIQKGHWESEDMTCVIIGHLKHRGQRTCGRSLLIRIAPTDVIMQWFLFVYSLPLFGPSDQACIQSTHNQKKNNNNNKHSYSWAGNPWSGLVYLSAGEISSVSPSACMPLHSQASSMPCVGLDLSMNA